MSTQFNFNGKLVKLPGVYTKIESGVNNQPLELSYGNVLIVDTDDANTYGGGSAINGAAEQGEGSIYPFDNIRDLQNFVGGGLIWDLALPLFRPFNSGSDGASTVSYVRAMASVAGTATLSFTTGGDVVFTSKYEGLCGNGIEGVTDLLTQGFGWTMEAGVVNVAKFRFKFWRGTYKGVDSQGAILDGTAVANSAPEIVATSPEITLLSELVTWANDNFDFQQYFSLVGTGITGDTIVAGDLAATTGNQLFAGGTQTASASALQDALTAAASLDYTFILALDSGANATSADNYSLQLHIETDAKYQKYMVVAGGDTKTEFTTESIAAANGFDSNRVMVVHGGCKIQDRLGGLGLRTKDSLYKAALVLGRMCGLAPQIPITFKGIGIAGETHRMSIRERETALDEGVLTTNYDSEIAGGIFVITSGINTMQDNKFVVNNDGSSHLMSVERIAAQLNKEIEINAKNTLLGNQSVGPNRSTLSPAIVIEWVQNFLRTKEATTTQDNLILSSQDITVTTVQDAYKINYGFVPNFEVNKLFITGLILDPNLI
jgi:hypothetical protein